MTYMLEGVATWTGKSSRVYHVSSHEEGDYPHTLCSLDETVARKLASASKKHLATRTMCWKCRDVLLTRHRDLQAARARG